MTARKKIVLGSGLENFEVTNDPHSGRFVDVKWGLIDFYTMTEKQANRLIKQGFPYLKEKLSTAKRGK